MQMESWHSEVGEFKSYIWNSRWYIIVYTGIFFLIYGAWLFNTNPRIDTEHVINSPFTTYNWLAIGRYGLILTEYVFGLRWFNPFISTTFGYTVLWTAGVCFGYLLWRAMRSCHFITAGFGLLCFVSPIITEQLYFDLQTFQVAWAYCLCAVGVGMSYWGIINRSKLAKLLAVLCMVWSFSSYQAFCALHIAAVTTCYILLYRRWTILNTRVVSERVYWKLIAWHVGLFIIAMVINTIITKLFFSGSSYLNNQIQWGTIPIVTGVMNILSHLTRAFTGTGNLYTGYWGALSVLTITTLLSDAVKNRHKVPSIIYVMAGLGLQFCPFLLTFLLGVIPTPRTQIVYPFVLACNAIILLGHVWRRIWIKYLYVLFIVAMFFNQANSTARFIYTDEIRTQEDIRLANSIEQKINEVAPGQNKIALVGAYFNRLNNACIRGELIGTSIFSCNYAAEPHFWDSSARACTVMRTIGVEFVYVSPEQMMEARRKALFMPCWPAKNSIADMGDYVIVKLSEDPWPEEVMETLCNKIASPALDNKLQYAVDSVAMENNRLVIQGWLFQPGVNSNEMMPEVILKHKTTNECMKISAARMNRPDLITAFENGALYKHSGYKAIVSRHQLTYPISDYTLILGCRNLSTNETHYSQTQYIWPKHIL